MEKMTMTYLVETEIFMFHVFHVIKILILIHHKIKTTEFHFNFLK